MRLFWKGLDALLGFPWGSLGAILGTLEGLVGVILEAIDQRKGGPQFSSPLRSHQAASWGSRGTLLGLSWALLGPYWGRLGARLERSWGPLGSSGGPLEAILEARTKRATRVN